MANKHRGEVAITLCGKEYVLRPTFGALCDLEDKAEMPLLTLVTDMERGKVRLRDIALVIWAGFVGFHGSETLTLEEVGELIMREGLLNVMQNMNKDGVNPISEFLLNGVLGGEEPDAVEGSDDPKQEQGEEVQES